MKDIQMSVQLFIDMTTGAVTLLRVNVYVICTCVCTCSTWFCCCTLQRNEDNKLCVFCHLNASRVKCEVTEDDIAFNYSNEYDQI